MSGREKEGTGGGTGTRGEMGNGGGGGSHTNYGSISAATDDKAWKTFCLSSVCLFASGGKLGLASGAYSPCAKIFYWSVLP